MGDAFRRFFVSGETWQDDLVGGLASGLAVLLIFRFAFGDPWAFATAAGVLVAAAVVALGAWGRRRRARRAT